MREIIINGKRECYYTVSEYKLKKNISIGLPTCKKRGKTPLMYYNIPCAFDIETTNIASDKPYAFMYHWQFCFNNRDVIFGTTWEEYKELLTYLKEELSLTSTKRLCVYVHNLAFEFQFLYSHFIFTEVFAREKRKVIKAFCDGIEYRCSYYLSNMSLAKFCENCEGVMHYKLTGTYDYRKMRTPTTTATPHELRYDYNDVKGLTECIAYKLKEDTIATIPLTSTGYVRRDFRKAMFSNKRNRDLIGYLSINANIYSLLKEAFRGGNTHANSIYVNTTIPNVKSYDLASSYPASMLIDKYPMTPFMDGNVERFGEYLENGYAMLFRVKYKNIRFKATHGIPYIPVSKCTYLGDYVNDNGRVYKSDCLIMTLTDIDFNIISKDYDFDTYAVTDLYISKYGYLPNEYREKIVEYFKAKTMLKNVEGKEYEYMKSKNRLNSAYGMMVTDICNDEITFNGKEWDREKSDIEDMIRKHNRASSTFLAYQWGVWVTANARKRLEDMLHIVGEDVIYTDTDSIKFVGEHDKDFAEMNEFIKEKSEKSGITTTAVRNGKIYYMGIWDFDGSYDYFKTLGAKKYISVHGKKCYVTVAGLNKNLASLYLTGMAKRLKCNPTKLFTIGQKFVRSSGRTTAHYNDTDVHQIKVNNENIITGSNVAILDTTYILGITDEYAEFLGNVK